MKLLFTLFAFHLSLFSSVLVTEAHYESGITIYGKVGTAKITLRENSLTGKYKVTAVATSSGLVKAISKSREDTMISEGNVVDGYYKPTRFTKLYTTDSKTKKIVYDFDYKNSKVLKTTYKTKWINKTEFNPFSFTFTTTVKSVDSTKSQKIALKKNDYLSLYLNMRKNNLNYGEVNYIDQKSKDSVTLKNSRLFTISKESGAQSYDMLLSYQNRDIFFKKIETNNVSFYGDAYLKKVSQKVTTIK